METIKIEVPKEKAANLQQIATLSNDSLKILADKSRIPGIEGKLKAFQGFIK